MHGRSLPALLALVAACAPAAGTASRYVAPTDATVVTSTEEARGDVPAQLIYVTNLSTVPVTVYSVTLRQCENIKQSCEPSSINLKLPPGARRQLKRVEPRNPEQGFRYSYTFGWRADSARTAALGVLADNGDASARATLQAYEQARADQSARVGGSDEELGPRELESLAARAGALRVTPDSLVLRIGDRVRLDAIRVMLHGKDGEPLGRVRALRWRIDAGPLGVAPPDTLVARSAGGSEIELQLPDSIAPSATALHQRLRVPVIVRARD